MNSGEPVTSAYAEPQIEPAVVEEPTPSSVQIDTAPAVAAALPRPGIDGLSAARPIPRPAPTTPPRRRSGNFGQLGNSAFHGGSSSSSNSSDNGNTSTGTGAGGATSSTQVVVRGSNFQVRETDFRPRPADAGSFTGAQSEPFETANPCSAPPPPGLNLPAYQPWPPEEASSRVALDRLIGPRGNLSLYDTGELLREALNQSGYQQHAFYAVPGGFILVTETERTDPEGNGVNGIGRYQRPGEDRTGLLISIRDLFLERPPTYYRYIAIVVTDRPFCSSGATLTLEEASARVRRGLTDLTDETRDIAFEDRYRVTALIYEFVNDGIGYDLSMVAPGRIPPQDHLALSGLSETIPQSFIKARNSTPEALP